MNRREFEDWFMKLKIVEFNDEVKFKIMEEINDTIDEEILNTH